MKISYLQLSPTEHGVNRYGRLLGQAVEQQGASVSWAQAALGRGSTADRQALNAAGQSIDDADLCHFQFNFDVWGNEPDLVESNLAGFLEARQRPTVVTIHDASKLPGAHRKLTPSSQSGGRLAKRPDPDRYGGRVGPAWMLYRRIKARARRARSEPRYQRAFRLLRTAPSLRFAFSELEADFLQSFGDCGNVAVVPHFIEPHAPSRDPLLEQQLDLAEDAVVVTLLGFIHPRKGHDIVIEALPKLPENTLVVFAGAAASKHAGYLEQLTQHARSLGVEDRLRVTGYLGEHQLDALIARTNAAVCPFRFVNASGSLSTWLATRTPIVASRAPQLEAYAAVAGDRLGFFQPGDPDDLVEVLAKQLSPASVAAPTGTPSMLNELSINRVATRHLTLYEQCLSSSAA